MITMSDKVYGKHRNKTCDKLTGQEEREGDVLA